MREGYIRNLKRLWNLKTFVWTFADNDMKVGHPPTPNSNHVIMSDQNTSFKRCYCSYSVNPGPFLWIGILKLTFNQTWILTMSDQNFSTPENIPHRVSNLKLGWNCIFGNRTEMSSPCPGLTRGLTLTFSVAKATLESQMSVCQSVRPSQKPLNLSES